MSGSLKESIANNVFISKYKCSKTNNSLLIKNIWIENWWCYGNFGSVKKYLYRPQNNFYQLIINFEDNNYLKNKTVVLPAYKNYFSEAGKGLLITNFTEGLKPDSLKCILVEGDNINVLNEKRIIIDSFSIVIEK